jgi:hypothetical protein
MLLSWYLLEEVWRLTNIDRLCWKWDSNWYAIYKKSNLPDFVDIKLVNKLIIKIRKEIYGL